MDPIKDIIAQVIGQMSKAQPAQKIDMGSAWLRLCPGNGSRVMGFKEGTMTVHVDSAARMISINGKKEVLLEGMQKEFPEIKRIFLKVGKI